MINDRGKIKWSSLMLPEHVEKLHDLFEEELPIKKPMLSEDQWHEIEYLIHQAISSEAVVSIRCFKERYIYTSSVSIQKIDLTNNIIIVIDQDTAQKKHLYIADILGVEIMEGQ